MKKTKLLTTIVIICFILSSCSNLHKQQVNNSESQKSINIVDNWKLIDKKFYDIDSDGKEDNIILYWLQDNNIVSKLKITVNNKEKIIEFDPSKTIGINSINLEQFVNLEKDNKGILIKLNSEGEIENKDSEKSPPYWSDHSFLVIGYTDNELTIILDGVNQPYNLHDNYKVKYIGDYNIEFKDNATGFSAEYCATLYKSQGDGVKRLQTINENQASGISINYFNVKAKDINADGIDEIICSKYIPGLYHADLLGIIDYTFTLKNGKYFISNEALKYDSESGMSIVKQIEIK